MTDWHQRHQVVPSVYILLRQHGQLLLLKRANTGYSDGYFSLPAGHLDGGESAVMAAVREAHEEVGVTIKPGDLRLVHTQHRVADGGDYERMNLFFETTTWQGIPKNAEPDKCSEIRWASLDALPAKLVPELEHLLKHLATHEAYGDFGF